MGLCCGKGKRDRADEHEMKMGAKKGGKARSAFDDLESNEKAPLLARRSPIAQKAAEIPISL